MKFDPTTTDPAPGGARPAGGGIRSRVEAAMKAGAPAPKGKALVMMILGVVVLGALVWDFTGRSGPSRRVRDNLVEGGPVVANADPSQGRAGRGAGATLEIELVGDGDIPVALDETSATALLAQASESERPALRRRLLEALIRPAGGGGEVARQAFIAASRFANGAEPSSQDALLQLKHHAYLALLDDATAPTAILFLSRLPEGGGADAALALDAVIRNVKRPLLLRLAAARARLPEGRAAANQAVIDDPMTHPALRDALR